MRRMQRPRAEAAMNVVPSGLSVGSQGDDVVLLPESLRRVGLTVGDVAGMFGPAIHRALIEFQRSRALPVPGDVDDCTATRIEQASERIVAGTSAVVHSQVLAADDSPMPGVTVKTFHKTVRREMLLGEATTTRIGTYLICSAAEDRRDTGAAVDPIVRTSTGGDVKKVLIESSVVPDAPVDVELHLRATTSASRGLFEVPRTFAKYNMGTFSVRHYRTGLERLPASVSFPDALGDRAYHDPATGTLHFLGVMAEAQRTRLEGPPSARPRARSAGSPVCTGSNRSSGKQLDVGQLIRSG
jgi:hypothetical protein